MAISCKIMPGKPLITRAIEKSGCAKPNMGAILITIIKSKNRITGRTGGASGGIPVKSQETSGEIMATENAKRRFNNILPNIIGKNIGKNIAPSPTR